MCLIETVFTGKALYADCISSLHNYILTVVEVVNLFSVYSNLSVSQMPSIHGVITTSFCRLCGRHVVGQVRCSSITIILPMPAWCCVRNYTYAVC